MKSGSPKQTSKKSFLTEEDHTYLAQISEKDPVIQKLYDFYQNYNRKGVDVFVNSMNQSLYLMGMKIEELQDIDFSDMKSVAQQEKYDLLLRISKDGMGIAKTLKEIERLDREKASSAKNSKKSDEDNDSEPGEDEIPLGEDLIDPNNPEHQRSIIDRDADDMRTSITGREANH